MEEECHARPSERRRSSVEVYRHLLEQSDDY
jgi:hypothetical protein